MTHLLDEPFPTMNGETTTLRNLGGERWLVVNVASACGATPQYAGLQELHETHEDLTVVGFPCNQFGACSLLESFMNSLDRWIYGE